MHSRSVVVLAFSAFVLIHAAEAQMQRTFVASNGVDSNPCSRTAPCRSFGTAVGAALPGGEVVVLDSAGYGTVTITQSVSIIAPSGVYAGITAFAGDAIAVNAPGATVVLQGLTLNGEGADTGIDAIAIGVLHVQSCVISKFSGAGLLFASGGRLFAEDTVARENFYGINIAPTALAIGLIDRCRIEKNGSSGAIVQGSGTPPAVTMGESIFAGNGDSGIEVDNAEVNAKSCIITGNQYGVSCSSAGVATVSDSMVADNQYGFFNSTGTFNSYGTNELSGNATQTSGTITPVTRQ